MTDVAVPTPAALSWIMDVDVTGLTAVMSSHEERRVAEVLLPV